MKTIIKNILLLVTVTGLVGATRPARGIDCAPLTITCPGDITNACSGEATTPVFYPDPIVTGDCNAGFVCFPPSGANFPSGTTWVTCTATNSQGASNSCSFAVTVPPYYNIINPPPGTTLSKTNGVPLLSLDEPLPPGQCSTNLTFDLITTDCDGVSTTNTVTKAAVQGALSSDTQVCFDDTDVFGNTITICSFAYRLTAVRSPTIISAVGTVRRLANGLDVLYVPMDPGQCSAVVTFDVVSFTCGSSATQTVTDTAYPGPVGPMAQTCFDSTDVFGNTITFCYILSAIDAEPPVITCPGNITSNAAPGTCAAVVTFATPGALDNCDPSPTVICSPPSGSSFSAGTTPVTCRAIDHSGNTNSCTFTVTVLCDADGDGVPNDRDQCPGTPAGTIVNAHGCSIEQLVPCDGPAPGKAWRRHGQYVRAVVVVATDFLRANLITKKQWAQIVTKAALSKCGWNRLCDRDGDADWRRNWDCDRDRDWCRNTNW